VVVTIQKAHLNWVSFHPNKPVESNRKMNNQKLDDIRHLLGARHSSHIGVNRVHAHGLINAAILQHVEGADDSVMYTQDEKAARRLGRRLGLRFKLTQYSCNGSKTWETFYDTSGGMTVEGETRAMVVCKAILASIGWWHIRVEQEDVN